MAAHSPSDDSLVDLMALTKAIAASWRLLGVGLVFGALSGVAYGLLARPTFEGTVLVSIDSEAQGGLAAMLGGQVNALASLAGINVGQGKSRKAEYIALLQSRSFIERFLRHEEILEEVYDWGSRGLFRASSGRPESSESPSIDDTVIRDAVDYFLDSLFAVVEDKKSGLVTVQIEWHDPREAADWANSLVELFNDDVRVRAGASAQRRLAYLEAELARSGTTEVRESVSRLMESELNTIMITNVQRDYALRVVESATPSPVSRPKRPKRLQAVVLGGFTGLVVSMVVALTRRRRDWWPTYVESGTDVN